MNTLGINLTEVKRLKLNLNEYLTLLNLQGTISFKPRDEDIDSLLRKGYLSQLGAQIVLSPKAVRYFEANELFEEFYNTFPHTVPDKYGEERPLRTVSSTSQSAAVTKSIWKKKVKGDVDLQQKIIEILKAEIDWRKRKGGIQFMNNIDTWLRQHNWEKYEYLLKTNNDEFTDEI